MKNCIKILGFLALFVFFKSKVVLAAPSLEKAVSLYNSGSYDAARNEFTELAQYGIVTAHYNLAIMASKGQSFPPTPGLALGFLNTATQLGAIIDQSFKASVKESAEAANQIKISEQVEANFGKQALVRDLLKKYYQCNNQIHSQQITDTNYSPARILPNQNIPNLYPTNELLKGRSGMLVASALIDEAGRAFDPRIEAIIPQQNNDGFFSSVTEYFQAAKFSPMYVDGKPVITRYYIKAVFNVNGKNQTLWDQKKVNLLITAAKKGDPDSEYAVSFINRIDPTTSSLFKIESPAQSMGLLFSAAFQGVPDAQLDISNLFRSQSCKESIDIGDTWLEQAAKSKQPRAKLILAKKLLDSKNPEVYSTQIRTLLSDVISDDDRYALKHASFLLATSKVPGVSYPQLALEGALKLKGEVKKAQALTSYSSYTATVHGTDIRKQSPEYFYTDSPDPEQDIVLAAALASNYDYENAIIIQKRAISKASKIGWNTLYLETMLSELNNKTMPDYSRFYLSWQLEKINNGDRKER